MTDTDTEMTTEKRKARKSLSEECECGKGGGMPHISTYLTFWGRIVDVDGPALRIAQCAVPTPVLQCSPVCWPAPAACLMPLILIAYCFFCLLRHNIIDAYIALFYCLH
jgi:hypothetical protein